MRLFLFTPARPRHPLLRLLLGIAGLALAVTLLMFGFALVAVLAGVGAVAWLLRQFLSRGPAAVTTAPARPAPPGVIEGEFVVVRETERIAPR